MTSSLRSALRSAEPERPDALELWRIADRVARNAEVRVVNEARTRGTSSFTADAVLLRQKANELLSVALGDIGGVREPHHTAETPRA